MSSSSGFFTQATNFISAVSGGVDPRTGLFSAVIGLGQLVGNRNLGPSLPLTLTYSPLTTTDTGFGTGVSLGLTTYDTTPDSRLLALSTGEQYMVRESDTEVNLEQNKLDTVRVTKRKDSYRIVHKSGDVEYLTGPQNAFTTKVPTTLLTPAGHRLNLSWDFHAEQPRLKTVKDENDTLLSVDYDNGSATTLRILPAPDGGYRPEGYKIVLLFMNDRLATVRHYGPGEDKAPLEWTFEYTVVRGDRGHWLTKVTMPGGMTEEATYCDDGYGHQFPAPAPLPSLPYVIQFAQRPGGGQKQITATYEYDDRNFLGGPRNSGVTWHPDKEGLYDLLTDYTYGSTETRTCGGQTTTITRRYNQFHLQTERVARQNGYTHSAVTVYYAVTGRPFSQQPPQFQLPAKRTVTWTDPTDAQNPRPEVTLTTFDDCGNPRSKTDPDGTVTTWTYYDAKGEGDDCPPEPNGFTRLLRDVTHTPPATGFDTPVHTTSYRYKKFAAATDSGISAVVLKSSEQHCADGQLLTKKEFTYSAADAELGRITSMVETHYPEGESGASYATTHTFDFSVDGDALVQTHKLTTHDKHTLKRWQRRSRFTGRLWSATDPQTNTATMAYDGLGRMLSHTRNTGDPLYQARDIVEYDPPGGAAPFVVTSIDARGNTRKTLLDGAGRPVQYLLKDTDGNNAWHTVQTLTYDEQGRLSATTSTDQERGGAKLQLTRTYTYDDWGGVSTTTFTDGACHLTSDDPVKQTSTVQLRDPSGPVTGREVTTYNARWEPVSVERFDLKNTSAGTRSVRRDGWGRVRSATDEAGNTTLYDYDVWGRPTTTTLPDGTKVTSTYAPSSPAALTTSIALGQVPYGTRAFDGLGRVITSTSGGRTWAYGYGADEDRLPSSVTAPDKQTTTYHYIPQLDGFLHQVQAGTITQTYTPDPVAGNLTAAQAGKVSITRKYFPSGLLRTDTTTLPSQPDRSAQWSYTVCGLPQTYTEVDGAMETTTRDSFGRTRTIEDPATLVTLTYDSASRLTQWTAQDKQSQHTLTTALTLDDFGREVKRTLTDSQGGTWTLTQTWQKNDLLSGRSLSYGGSTRQEFYTYSRRNQLVDYRCSGGSLPQNERGTPVTRQTFGYDVFGNVTTCRSYFATFSDTAGYLYDNMNDPCQLTGVTHTHASFPRRTTLGYDAAGRLTTDEAGRTLTYDALGRLQSAGAAASYGYDPLGRLLTQTAGGTTSALYYRSGRLTAVITGDEKTRLLPLGTAYAAQHRTTASGDKTLLLGTDANGSVLVSSTGQNPQQYAYTAYGNRPVKATDSVLGYTGQRTDPVTGRYHLGNGYRAYNPVLMRFNAPDSLSPFGAGGINPYTYCTGDPVNHTDPTGHLSWGAWLSIGVGVLGVGLAVFTAGASIAAAGSVMAAIGAASATELAVGALGVTSDITSIASGALEEASPKASSILGYVSMGTGLAGGVGEARAGAAAERETVRLAEEAPEKSGLRGAGETRGQQHVTGAKVDVERFSDIDDYDARRGEVGEYMAERLPSGGTAYSSQFEVDEMTFDAVLERTRNNSDRRTYYLGHAHGNLNGQISSMGAESPSLLIEARRVKERSSNVTFRDAGLLKQEDFDAIFSSGADVIMGFCWSANTPSLMRALNRGPLRMFARNFTHEEWIIHRSMRDL